MQQIRADPAGPVIMRDIAQAEIEYEQMRELCNNARRILIDAAQDNTIPPEFWKASLSILRDLEAYTEYLRKVPRGLVRISILQYYGLPRRGQAEYSGIVTESDSNGLAIHPPDLLATIHNIFRDRGDSL